MLKKHDGQNEFGDRSNEIFHVYNRLIGICINDENNYSDRIVVMVNSLNEVFLFIRFLLSSFIGLFDVFIITSSSYYSIGISTFSWKKTHFFYLMSFQRITFNQLKNIC